MTGSRTPLRVMALALWASGAAGWAQGPPQPPGPPQVPPGQVGRPWTGPPAVRETAAQIMERQRVAPAVPEIPVVRRIRVRPEPDLPQHPSAPPVSQWPPPGVPRSAAEVRPEEETSPLAAQTVEFSFTGATVSDSGFLPPDSMGDVGPTQYVVMLNGRIRTFTKSTGTADGALNATTDTFFASVKGTCTNCTSDPRVRYDRLSGRWFFIMITTTVPNRIVLAVSDGASITSSTVFAFFFIPIDTIEPTIASNCLFDYPSLGVDTHALYIGGNTFCGNPLRFSNTDGFVVRKSSMVSGGPLVVTVFRNLIDADTREGLFTPQGVDHFDPAATEGYFVAVDNRYFGRLVLRRVTDPGGTPAISGNISLVVPSTSFPTHVPHLGMIGQRKLDAIDDRLFMAHLRDGRLWTTHNISVNTSGVAVSGGSSGARTASRWYEIEGVETGSTLTLVQSGTVFDSASSNPVFYWMPSILVSGQGHAAMGFSRAGSNERANAAYTGRLAGDAPGTMQTAVLYTASTTNYNAQTTSPQRWGDYSYVSVDPDDDMTLWTVQEFCNATNSWAVRVARLRAPPPPAGLSAAPSVVAAGQASLEVTINGDTSSGAGFFDPGAGFAKRLAALVSGGVTVNSVTYVNPGTVLLDLDTTGSGAGTKDITLTNPDGQTTLGAGLLTVSTLSEASSTAVVSSGSPTVFGQSVTFTATVTGGAGTPTGTVQFKDGPGNLDSPVPLDGSGQAQLAVTTLNAGAHSITAVYSGDGTYLGSTSAAVAHTVEKANTSASVTSAPNPSIFGHSVTLTATVSVEGPGGGTAEGTVEFFDNGNALGTAPLASGQAALTTTAIGSGERSLTAQYLGSSNFNGSTSPVHAHTAEIRRRPGQIVTPGAEGSADGPPARLLRFFLRLR